MESNPWGSGEADLALRRRARQSPAFGRWARSVVVFLSVRKHQRLMVICSTSLGTPVFGPRHKWLLVGPKSLLFQYILGHH